MVARTRGGTSRRGSVRKGSAPSARTAGSFFRGPGLFLAALVLLAIAGWLEGPVVVRQVSSAVGLRRVESHAESLREAARESGLDVHFLAGVMYVESRGRVGAVSPVGALGLFQLMPAAASDAARRLKLPAPSRDVLLTDARLNARLGANHLRQLVRSLGPDLERVLVAYNAGRGRLLGWEKAEGGWAAWRAKHAKRADSPTLAYAQDVLRFADRFRERGNLAPLPSVPSVSSGATPATKLATELAPAAAPSATDAPGPYDDPFDTPAMELPADGLGPDEPAATPPVPFPAPPPGSKAAEPGVHAPVAGPKPSGGGAPSRP